MRASLLSVLFVLSACDDTSPLRDLSPPRDASVLIDQVFIEEDSLPRDLGEDRDAGTGRDLVVQWDLGGVGAPCRSSCECGDIMGCFKGVCVPTCAIFFCCTRGPCFAGHTCEQPDGSRGYCPGGDMGPPDLGGSPDMNPCGLIDCRGGGTEMCAKVGCTACVPSGSMMVCSR